MSLTPRLGQTGRALLGPGVALLFALLCGELLVLCCGAAPGRVFSALLAGTWGNPYGLGQVLFKATPLVLTGLAVAIPYRAGLLNIGAEGQVVLGALATGVVGMSLPAACPAWLALPAAAGAGFLAGAAWGALPGWLKARSGAHEVITSIMLNFVALALANWLVAAHLAVPESLHTPAVVAGARLARLARWLPALHGSALNLSTLLALGLASWAWWLLFRTRLGFGLRTVGCSPRAALFAGISPGRIGTLAMAVGGGMAGLVGCNFVLGYKGWYEDGFSGGVGFVGIAVALLGRAHPAGVVLAALLFGTLSQGGLAINALVPKELVDVLQALVVLALLCTSRDLRRAALAARQARSAA
jgi:simple sugar transport system permease protein